MGNPFDHPLSTRQRDHFESVMELIHDGLFVMDRQGRVVLANTASREVLKALAAGQQSLPDEGCHRRRNTFRDTCLACLADFTAPPRSCMVAIADRSYELRAAPLGSAENGEEGRAFVLRDISEHRREAARQAQQERLSVVGEISSAVAHEINNPLTAIAIYSQMLLDRLDLVSPLHGYAEIIGRHTQACRQTLTSLLSMAAGQPTERSEIELSDVVEVVVELLRPLASKLKTEVEITRQAAGSSMWGDEHQLRQAVINLVMNALQSASQSSGGRVVVATETRDTEVVVRVEDNGPGVPAALTERIFEPFFTTKAPGQGTGLGLSTSRRIAESHGGRLEHRPCEGSGAVFELRVPRLRTARESAALSKERLELAS